MCVLQWRTGAWHTGVLARTLRRRDASAPAMWRTGVLARTLRRRGRQRTGSFRHTGVLARISKSKGPAFLRTPYVQRFSTSLRPDYSIRALTNLFVLMFT